MKKWMCNKNFNIITILNVIMALIAIFVFVPGYETNDDFTMGVVSSGAYGSEYSPFLVFTNLIYGYILKLLGYVWSSLNWYVVSQYILTILSIIAVMYILSKYTSLAVAILINQIMWYISFFEMFRTVQFTRTAGIVVAAGCIIIWYSFMKENKLVRIIGIAFCVIGSFVRVDSFPIAISFFCVFALIYALGNKISKKKILEIGVTIAVVVCTVGAFLMVDRIYYNTSPEWEGYGEYNKVRADLMDYGFPLYKQYADKYQKLGFSQNDIAVIKRWMLADYEKVTYEDLKAIFDWKEPQKITGEVIKSYLSDFLERNYTNKIFWLWIMLIIVLLNLNKICKLYAGANIIIVGALYGYLYYIQRILPRVEYVIWISAVFSLTFAIFSCYKLSRAINQRVQRGVIISALTFTFVFIAIKYSNEQEVIKAGYKQQPRDILEKLSEEEENVYLLDTPSFGTACLCYKPYLKIPDSYLSNFYYMGGWDTESPFNENLMKKLGLQNPMKDQIYKDNIYFVKSFDIGVDCELLYLQENYNKNVDVRLVERYNKYGIYKFFVNE